MTAAMGVGAVGRRLFTAARGRTGLRPMIIAARGIRRGDPVAAFSPEVGVAYAALLSSAGRAFRSSRSATPTIQLSAAPSMRGPAPIALWQVAFQGTTPVGGPADRWIIAVSDPRAGLAVGGASCLVAAGGGIVLARRYRAARPPAATPVVAVPAEGPAR